MRSAVIACWSLSRLEREKVARAQRSLAWNVCLERACGSAGQLVLLPKVVNLLSMSDRERVPIGKQNPRCSSSFLA